jgi:hypothetical protein
MSEKPEVVKTPAPIIFAMTRKVSVQKPYLFVIDSQGSPGNKSGFQQKQYFLSLLVCHAKFYTPREQIITDESKIDRKTSQIKNVH